MYKVKAAMIRPYAILLALVLLLSLPGCGKAEAEEEGLPAQTDSLVLYAGPYEADFLKAAVAKFSLLYPDVNVEVRDFGDFYDPQNEDNYMEVLKNDLAAGAGPDLILFDQYEFDDIKKTAESGAFQYLNGYIANDPDFNIGDYNSAVMDAGVIGGQRLLIPLSYTVDILLTTQEALAAENQKLPATFEDLCQQMADYGQKYHNDTGKFFNQDYQLYDYLLPAAGLSIVDYVKKEVTVDNDDFRGFIDAYKEIYEMEWGRSQEGIYVGASNSSYTAEDVIFTESGKILYINEFYPAKYVEDYAGLLSGQTPVYTAVPSVAGKPIATVEMYAAVNSSGKNKANAYNLLKIMLSIEMQNCWNQIGFYYYPVRNGVLKDCIEEKNKEIAESRSETPYGTVQYASISDEAIDEFVNVVSDVSCSFCSNTVRGFIWDEMQPYFEGQKSYEECMKSLVNKLNLYINE